jgi:hypothetical protein
VDELFDDVAVDPLFGGVAVATAAVLAAFSALLITTSHDVSLRSSGRLRARRRPGLSPVVEDVATAIEDDVLDALFDGAFGDELADEGSRVLVRALVEPSPSRVEADARGHAAFIIDDLGVDVLGRTEDRQTRATIGQGLEAGAGALGTTHGGFAR